MLFGVLYWAGWRIILPQVFGYELVPRKETLEDGTVVTLVRLIILSACRPKEANLDGLVLSSQDQKSLSDTGSLSFPSFSFSFCLAQMFVLFVTLIHDCHETYNQYPPT